MPPIFGIINTNLHPVITEYVTRMVTAATYTMPRQIVNWTGKGYYMAAAVLNNGNKDYAVKGPWVCIADASIYKSEQTGNEALDSAELILKLWLEYKEECVKHLYGDFAFLIFNIETGEIFCGRDHLGVRPLFYAINEDTFVFASELRLISASMIEKPRVDKNYLLDTLVTKITPKNQTPFEFIRRLSPAHFLQISHNCIISEVYWRPDSSKRILLHSDTHYINLLREKLVNAVEIRCRDAKTGTELSGGLDSSAIAGIAAKSHAKGGKILSGYSNVFPRGTAISFKDERDYINEMTRFTSLNWTGIDSLGRNIPELLHHAISVQGCFIQQNYSIFSSALYEAASKDQISVLLSGFGGDELVSARVAVQWNEMVKGKYWHIVKDELFYKGVTFKSLAKAFFLAIRYLTSVFKKSGYTSGVFTQELLDKRFNNIPLQPGYTKEQQLRQRQGEHYKKHKRKSLAMKQADRIMHEHLPQRMEYCYAAAAQYGIEYRYPLLDVDLLETMLAFPPWMKQRQGVNRYAFREAITGFVPEKIRLKNDKSGATIPQTYFSLVNEKEKILEIVGRVSSSPFLSSIFDFSKFARWYEKLVERDPNKVNYLMHGAFYTYLMIILYYLEHPEQGIEGR